MESKKFYTQDEIDEIINNTSIIDYFMHLENRGIVKFDKKLGRDLIYKNSVGKYSVNEKGFYDFHNNEVKGKQINAVMHFENKNWKEALDFLRDFSKIKLDIPSNLNRKKKLKENKTKPIKVEKIVRPWNNKLLDYFESRGIDKKIVSDNAKQVHYSVNDKNYFGIGIENNSGGFEIRNPMIKTKIGNSDISIIQGVKKNEIIVFEGMTDYLSFLQLLKDNKRENTRTIIILNSVSNTNKLIENLKDFKESVYLLLDGDNAGEHATNQITEKLKNANVKDIRPLYKINSKHNNDLNDYLKEKKGLERKKNSKLVDTKKEENETKFRQRTISNINENGRRKNARNDIQSNSISQSEQKVNGDSEGRPRVDGNNVGDGLKKRTRGSLGQNFGQRDSTRDRKPSEEKQSSIGGQRNSLDEKLLKSNNKLEHLLNEIKDSKITNKQISDITTLSTNVSDDNKILLNQNYQRHSKLKEIINQYRSGGVEKSGRGILDEYYTDEAIVNSVKNLLNKSIRNKNNLSILEPSVGTGNFIYAVSDFPNAKINTFEINETTAKIAKINHPEITVNLRSFETEFINENGFEIDSNKWKNKYDLVIGNPPYGSHRGFYKGLGEEPKISKYEDYFVKRSLDSLKDNGVLAMVLPSSWIDRQKKLKNADIINAFRLPRGVFKGTQVGTDIVLLRKNQKKQVVDISNYFQDKPEHILGEIKEKTNQFGKREKYISGDISDALIRIEHLQKENKAVLKTGNLFEDQTEVIKINAEKKQTVDKIKAKEEISDAVDKLMDIKFKSPVIVKEINKLNKLKKELNLLSDNEIKEKLKVVDKILSKKLSNNYKIQSEVKISKKILKYHFQKDDSIINTSKQNNPSISIQQLNAFNDTNYDGTLNNIEKHPQFANYIDGKWIHDFYYAEGNIYDKLKQLEIDKNDIIGKQYIKQKKLLESVIPVPKILEDIIISPNHEFVHNFSLGMREKEEVTYNTNYTISGSIYRERSVEMVMKKHSLADEFKDFVRNLPSDAFQGSSSWEVNSYVDNETVTGSDRNRNALVRERRKKVANDLFIKFIKQEMSQDVREEFVKEFNRKHNNIHIPDYSQFPLFSNIYENFKGKPLRLTDVQKAGIGRLTTKGVGALAHEVGFGKTLSGVLAMHEAMERGNAKRPLIVVPNDNILKQWVETIYETIPQAKVNILGNLGKSYDLSSFDNQDGEITLVTYSGFNNIGFSKEVTERLANKFAYISDNELKSVKNSERDVEIEKEKINELKGKMKRGKVYDWEDFGFDHLTFDEVHNANHIVGKVRIDDRRFASDFRNQNQRTSALGINTWMASQYIQEQNDGRNVTLLSATPFTNKPLEYYSVLSLVANNRLEEQGYFNVNNFFETFMEADNEMEIDAKGDVKYKTNVRRFKNNSLFQKLLKEFIDIKGEKDNPELVRPNRINKEYIIKQNNLTNREYDVLNDNFSESEKGAILTHILNARLIAISPYLSPYNENKVYSAKEFVEDSPKLKLTMDLIRQNKADNENPGQIIYSELAVNEFPKLKEYLVNEIGYDDKEVKVITGSTPKNNRIKIQNDFNNGKIKIVIGSEAIQEGMNLQKNTSDMYLLSLPYNFTTLRQIEGRAWRQGNKWESVRINYMLTEDSIDVFMLQKLQAKQARYLEAMRSEANILDISDISTNELKTALITNPITRAEIEIKIEKKRLESEKGKLVADSAFVIRKQKDVILINEKLNRIKSDIDKYKDYALDEKDREYWEREIKGKELLLNDTKLEQKQIFINLNKKGIDVNAIQSNIKLTDNKVAEIDKKIDELHILKEELISKYQEEKIANDTIENKRDFISERAKENKSFWKLKSVKNENQINNAEKKQTVRQR